MRLLSLHIENFGTLHDHTEQLENGLNVRLYPNGWGKSTLAVFIKAMLYGLPSSTRRSLIENERKRYTPWQGGVYGGSLDVEVEGEAYRIERTFGAKDADDTLSVLSLRTGQPVTLDWARTPGPSLFGVDASAYERSTYLSQRPDDQTKDGTQGIHAKLNRLVDATDDLSSYDSALSALDKRRQYYRLLKGEGGVIYQNEQRLAATERAIEQALSQKEALAQCRAHILDIKKTVQSTQDRLNETVAAEERLHRLGEWQAITGRTDALQAELDELDEERSQLQDKLGEHVPDQALFSRLEQAVQEEASARHRATPSELDEQQNAEYAALCRTLGTRIPSREELHRLRIAAQEYHRANALVSEDDRQRLGNVSPLSPDEQLRLAEQARKAVSAPSDATAAEAPRPTGTAIGLFAGALIALALLAGGILLPPLLAVGAAVALVTGIAALVTVTRKRARAAQLAHTAEQASRERQAAALSYERLIGEATCRLRFAACWNELLSGLPCPDAADAYWQTEQQLTRFERLSYLHEARRARNEDMEQARRELAEIQDTVRALLAPIPGAPQNGVDALPWLRETCAKAADLARRYDRKKQELDGLRAQYAKDIPSPKDLPQDTEIKDAEALRAEREALLQQRQALQATLGEQMQQLVQQQQQALRLEADAEELDALESERSRLLALILEQKQAVDAIVSAEKYLKAARENLSGRYLTVMKERFAHYMQLLTGTDAPVFTMDTQFRVKLRAAGVGRDTDAFSTGMRDLIAFCQRLSLVDAMFEGERPFLILDDPFTNLDDDTVLRAQALLDGIADRYQLLYLTCHTGRVPSKQRKDDPEPI